jgi:cytochrome P450
VTTATLAPLAEEVDAYLRGRPDLLADPYPLFRRLRAEAPVFRHEPLDQTLATTFADVTFISLHPELFLENTSGGSHVRGALAHAAAEERERLDVLLEWFWGWISEKDGPEHARLRGLARKSFTKRNVVLLRDRVQQIVDELLEPLVPRNEIELVSDFAYQLPMIVICELLDVPPEDRHLIRRWASELGAFIGSEHENVPAAYDALLEFRDYLLRIVERRRGGPTTDLLGALIGAEDNGDRLGDDELWVMMTVFLFAGHETTTNMIGNGLIALMNNREQWGRLVADPELVPAAVEELLRYDTSVQTVRRVAAKDVELGGTVVRAGDTVRMILASANRDPEMFPEPDRLDVGRRPDRQLAFGVGLHHCLGNQLARLELRHVLLTFVTRFPDLELNGEIVWRRSPFLRGPETLPMRLAT